MPEYVIKLDRKLDEENFLEFFHAKNPRIQECFPQIKTDKDIFDAINFTYSKLKADLDETIDFLKNNKKTLDKLAQAISRKLDYSWQGLDEITIIPGVCPVCPRWIDENRFMVCYFYYKNDILRICAHEMIHLLYFKKLRDLSNQNIDTEYPSKDWLISEIIVPVITGSQEIQDLVHGQEEPFITGVEVSQKQIDDITRLFETEKNIASFQNKALSVLN